MQGLSYECEYFSVFNLKGLFHFGNYSHSIVAGPLGSLLGSRSGASLTMK